MGPPPDFYRRPIYSSKDRSRNIIGCNTQFKFLIIHWPIKAIAGPLILVTHRADRGAAIRIIIMTAAPAAAPLFLPVGVLLGELLVLLFVLLSSARRFVDLRLSAPD